MEKLYLEEFNRRNFINALQRIELLEEKVFKKPKRIKATKSQAILLLKQLGILELIDGLNLSQNQRALLISVIIDQDPENVEKDLAQVHKKDSRLNTEQNFTFLVELFDKIKLEKQAKEADKTLIKIRQKSNK